jgi:hypothetical protein
MAEKLLLFALASRVDSKNSCHPSLRCLGLDSGLKSTAHISRTLTKLRERGLIETYERPSRCGRFPAHGYVLKVDGAPMAYKATSQLPKEQRPVCSVGKLSNPSLEVTSLKPEEYEDSTSSAHSGTADFQPETKNGETGKKQSSKKNDSTKVRTGADILRDYRRDKPTPQNIVGYWWALKHHYFPNTRFHGPQHLSSRQFNPLMVLFRKMLSATEAFELVWWVFEEWKELRQVENWNYYAASTYPTPPFILHNAELLTEVKMRYRQEWEPKIQKNPASTPAVTEVSA